MLPLLLPFLLMLLIMSASCAKEPSQLPDLPQTQIISLSKSWVAVVFEYFPLHAINTVESDVVWLSRQGDVFEVLEQDLEAEFLYNERNSWYRLRHGAIEGWAFGAGLRFFSTREESLNAAIRLKSGVGF